MKILITTNFIDRQASNLASAEVPAGTTMTVSAARGAELIGHKLGTPVAAEPTVKPKPKASRRSTSKSAAQAAAAETQPVPRLNSDTAAPAIN